MYEKQVAYLKKDKKWKIRQYRSITNDGDKLYIIGGKSFISLNTKKLQHQKHYHNKYQNNNNNNNNMQIILLPILPMEGHTLHKINHNLFISLFGKTTKTTNDIIFIHREDTSIFTTSFLKPTTSISPLKRYGHTSILLNNTIYVIGGASTLNHNTLFTDVWMLDWSTNIWIKLLDNINPIIGHSTILLSNDNDTTSLLTCFGTNQSSHHLHNKQFYDYCTLFNIHSLQYKYINNIPLKPRIDSTMVSVNDTHAIIYGGLSENNELLSDTWWIQLNNDNNHDDISFIFIDSLIPRAKHAALMISDDHLLINGGQYIGSAMDETKIYNINDFNSNIKINNNNNNNHHKLHSRAEPPSSSTNNSNNGLTGGAIGGMIVGILLAVGMAITLFIFIQRKHRQHRTYDIHSRAARFSLSTPPRQSNSIMERRSQIIQSPELARTRLSQMSFGSEFRISMNDHQHHPQNKRQSNLIIPSSSSSSSLPSMIPPSQNHNTTLESPSRQLYTNWICETPEPPTTITRNSTFVNNNNNNNNNNSNNSHSLASPSKDHHQPHPLSMCNNNNSTPSVLLEDNNKNLQNDDNNQGKKRFTLNLFKNNLEDHHTSFHLQSSSTNTTEPSSSQLGDTQTTTKRRSSLFGLSKFLNLTETTNQEMENNNNIKEEEELNKDLNQLSIQKEIRASLGSRSVSSIQWVGFNNDMDFPTNRSSPRLTVMNPRQSYTTISSSSGVLSGITSMSSSDDLHNNNNNNNNDQSPRNTSVYRLSQRELKSWDDNRLSLLITPPPPLHRQ